MAGSPALRIVRQSKPATPPARRVERAEIPPKGNSLHVPLPSTMTDVEIARELRVSPKTIRRMDEAGKIPAPVTVGARSLRWVRQKIVECLARWPPPDPNPPEPHKTKPGQLEFPWPDDTQNNSDQTHLPNETTHAETSVGRSSRKGT